METNTNVETTKHNTLTELQSMLGRDAAKKRFSEILGKKAPAFVSSIISVSKSQALADTDATSIVNAAVVAATLDLPINQNLGFAAIVPYFEKGKKVAQFQMMYKGFIQLAMRSGQYKTINVTDVKQGEAKFIDRLTGEIIFEWDNSDSRAEKPTIGYVAFFETLNGFRKMFYMTKEECEAHGKRYSKTYSKGVWATDFDKMAKKTVLKLLLSGYGTLSTEMQNAQIYDQAKVNGNMIEKPDEVEIEYIDNGEKEAKVEDEATKFLQGKGSEKKQTPEQHISDAEVVEEKVEEPVYDNSLI